MRANEETGSHIPQAKLAWGFVEKFLLSVRLGGRVFICLGGFWVFLGGVVLFCFVLLYLDREIFFADSLICVSDKRKTLNDPINFTLQVRILDCEFVQTYDV